MPCECRGAPVTKIKLEDFGAERSGRCCACVRCTLCVSRKSGAAGATHDAQRQTYRMPRTVDSKQRDTSENALDPTARLMMQIRQVFSSGGSQRTMSSSRLSMSGPVGIGAAQRKAKAAWRVAFQQIHSRQEVAWFGMRYAEPLTSGLDSTGTQRKKGGRKRRLARPFYATISPHVQLKVARPGKTQF